MYALPSICDAARLIRSGELTPLALVETCLERIRRLDDRVRAWVHVDEAGARRVAEEQTRLAAKGEASGPLFGIPIGIKDIIDVAGLPTECGSPLLRGNIARADAPVVAALRNAGAIILGKTVTTQFACFDPAVTRNPWNLDHSPGGSSSGSAAAVACETCLGAIGTQTGGSILRPAAYCGIVGFKPTFGAMSMEGIAPVSHTLDHVGPFARSVADADDLWSAIRGEAIRGGEYDIEQAELLIPEPWLEVCDPQLRASFERSLGAGSSPRVALRAIDVGIPLAEIIAAHRAIMASEAAEAHWPRYERARESFAPGIASLLEEGRGVSRAAYQQAMELQTRLKAALGGLLGPNVFLLFPATTTTAPPLSACSTGDPRMNSPISLAGLPAITIPGPLVGGLPIGIQLVGGHGNDRRLFDAALLLEALLPWNDLPPISREF